MKKIFIYAFLLELIFYQYECIDDINSLKFYFEYKGKKYNATMINYYISEKIVKQLPLESSFVINDNLLSIPLKSNIDTHRDNSTFIIEKGNILTDGKNLLIYYGINQLTDIYVLVGNIIDIDVLIDNTNISTFSHLSFKALCKSSIITNENVDISISNPSFKLFNKNSLHFEDIPKLYFGNNNEPLYNNCAINPTLPYEINCAFTEEEIKKYNDLYPKLSYVFEIIPECSNKI